MPGRLGTFIPIGMNALSGVIVGALVLLAVKVVQDLFRRSRPEAWGLSQAAGKPKRTRVN